MRYLKSLAALTWHFDKLGFSQRPMMEQTLVASPPSLQGILAVSLGYVCGQSKNPRELSKGSGTQTTKEERKGKITQKCTSCSWDNSIHSDILMHCIPAKLHPGVNISMQNKKTGKSLEHSYLILHECH